MARGVDVAKTLYYWTLTQALTDNAQALEPRLTTQSPEVEVGRLLHPMSSFLSIGCTYSTKRSYSCDHQGLSQHMKLY